MSLLILLLNRTHKHVTYALVSRSHHGVLVTQSTLRMNSFHCLGLCLWNPCATVTALLRSFFGLT